MQDLATLYPQKTWSVVNQQFSADQGQLAFAHANTLLALTKECQQPIIHFWTLEKTVILGMMDTKLPELTAATDQLTAAGYHYFVRNAGGLGIVADPGILNLGFYLPEVADHLSINAAYELMKTLFSETFNTSNITIEHFEVQHSYCPGEYDLSINGQKFAGIAQRRSKNGIAILLYASIEGDQQARGTLMQHFYQAGKAQQQTRWTFPDVHPETMANLADLLHQPLTVASVSQQLSASLQSNSGLTLQSDLQTLMQEADYQTQLTKNTQLLRRYQPGYQP